MVGHGGVFEDLDQRQVRVDLLCSCRPCGSPSHPRDGDPPVLHPRYEDTAGVRSVSSPGEGTVQQGLQSGQVGLDLADDAGEAALSKTVDILKVWMFVESHGTDVGVEVHCALLEIGSRQVLEFLQRVGREFGLSLARVRRRGRRGEACRRTLLIVRWRLVGRGGLVRDLGSWDRHLRGGVGHLRGRQGHLRR